MFESTRRGGAAKYISESNDDGLPPGYFGEDNGSNGGSISSDWNENIEDFDVPDISAPPGPVQTWPKHWPGNHSPAITKLVMDAGKVNGVQLVNPKADPEYKISTASLEKGIKVLSQYELLRDHVKNTVVSPHPMVSSFHRLKRKESMSRLPRRPLSRPHQYS